MTPEGERKLAVKKWLTAIGAYWFMPVQTGYGKKTLDFLCCYRGFFFAVETKGNENAYRPHQAVIAAEIESDKPGGVCFLVLDDASLLAMQCEITDWKYATTEKTPLYARVFKAFQRAKDKSV